MKRIPLSLGLFALVDDADYERVMAAGSWSARPSGRTVYAQRRLSRPGRSATTQSLHTFLTGWPNADHQNGDGLDNQRGNLREASHAQNMYNKRLYRNSTTGFKGVTRRKRDGRFQAQIQARGHHRHLGYHDTAEAAARGAGSATGSEATPPDATAATAPPARPDDGPSKPKGQPAPPAAMKKFAELIDSLELGTLADIADLLKWLCPGYSATVSEVKLVTSFLTDHLRQAEGDTAEACSAIWGQFRARLTGAGEPAGGDPS